MSRGRRSKRFLLPPTCAALVVLSGGGTAAGSGNGMGQAGSIQISGAAADDQTGESVAGVGDMNGDGRPDVVVNVYNPGLFAPGAAHVVFGSAAPANVDLAALGKRGFSIKGASASNVSGDSFSVAAAGDMNRDGLSDLLLGDALADTKGFASGSAYVVFGSASSANVDLAALGNRGFRISGAAADDLTGASVAGAGDVNGDGRPDVLVGTDPCCFGEKAESVYVVFGSASSSDVDLAALGNRGFRIDGAETDDFTSVSVAGAGDVNGDGRSDVLLGASGSAFVVFGKADTSRVDLLALGQGGFRIDGAVATDNAGDSVGSPGDVNGDGLADLLVGADYAGNNGREESGSAYVVYGSASAARVDLSALGQRGFRIDGAAPRDHAGISVAGAGDVNGDGHLDVVVGGSGELSFVVFGESSPRGVDLAALGQRGFPINGAAQGDFAGGSVAGAGDVNSDGRSDVLVGARYADSNGRKDSGAAYVVFGKASTETVELGGAADTTPPQLALGGSRSQRVLRQKGVIVTASCNEPCALKATGVMGSGRATKLPLTPASGRIGTPGRKTLKLSLPATSQKRLPSLLAQGKRASATVTVRAADAAGNATTAKRTIAVRR